MGLFDGKLGWDDAWFFPAAITDGAIDGGGWFVDNATNTNTSGKAKGLLGDARSQLGFGGSAPINPDFGVAAYGGDPVTAKVFQEQYQKGIQSGAGQVGMGVDRMNSAGGMGIGLAAQGRNATGVGMDAFGQGLGLAGQDRGLQMEAAGMQRDAALGLAPSAAQLQMRANASQIANQQRAQAASARGGNQAAAMRTAQANASQMALQNGQQMAALRAQEMAAARGAYGELGGQIRGQDIQQAGLGGQMAGLGFNAQGQGIGALQTSGAGIANIGQNREANYLSALQAKELAEQQARVDLENTRIGGAIRNRESNRQFMGGLIGTGGAVIGGMYGGPGGAAAGGVAGQKVGAGLAG
jgi:hypothetical protein